MKKRPSSACRSRSTPLKARPTSAQPNDSRMTDSSRPSQFKASSHQSQDHPTFVTTNKQLSNLPTLNKSSVPEEGGRGSRSKHRSQTDRSSDLLRGLVSAESGFTKTSSLEVLISTYLRLKSDIKVLRDFTHHLLPNKPEELGTASMKVPSAQEIFSPTASSETHSDCTRFVHILKLSELRDKYVFDLCSCLPVDLDLGMNGTLQAIPNTCSPRLVTLLTFFGTFMEIGKELVARGVDPAENTRLHALQDKHSALEQAFQAMKADAKILKAKYLNIMTNGGKQQGMARQQHTIDELELQAKSLRKKAVDAEGGRVEAVKGELKLKDDVLQLETQLAALKSTYESELGSLKPLVREQVSYTSGNIREIKDLKTTLLLSKERHSILSSHFEAASAEFQASKDIISGLRNSLNLMTEQAEAAQNEGMRLKKMLNLTAAAKMSVDNDKAVADELNSKLNLECEETKQQLQQSQVDNSTLSERLSTSEERQKQQNREAETLTMKYEAKCCEVASLESSLGDLTAQLSHAGEIKKKSKKKDRSSSSQIPSVTVSSARDNGGCFEGGEDSSSPQAEMLVAMAAELQEKAEEIRKKDQKIKRLEEKLKKSQSAVKDALDRVWQLEKAKLDEAAGALPQRRAI